MLRVNILGVEQEVSESHLFFSSVQAETVF
jgi:hypothetical protein